LALLVSIASLKLTEPLADLKDNALHGVGGTSAGGGAGSDDDEFFAAFQAGKADLYIRQRIIDRGERSLGLCLRKQEALHRP
jgi:hypothetical protein